MTDGSDWRSPEEALAELGKTRHEIERIDRELVALLAQRVALGKSTAALKRAAGLPILDPQREAEVIRRAVTTAREHDLPVEAVREVFWHVVGLSRRAQEENS
jgi:chorismate mutase